MCCSWLTVAVLVQSILAVDFAEKYVQGKCSNSDGEVLRSKLLHLKRWTQGGLESECRTYAKACKDAAAYTTRGTNSDGDCIIQGENGYPTCKDLTCSGYSSCFEENPAGGSGRGKAVGVDPAAQFGSRTHKCYLPVTTTTTTTVLPCSSYSCPATQMLKANAASIKGADTSTCCKAKTCDAYACGSGYSQVANAASVKGSTSSVCCKAKTCDMYACRSGYSKVANAASVKGSTSSVCCKATSKPSPTPSKPSPTPSKPSPSPAPMAAKKAPAAPSPPPAVKCNPCCNKFSCSSGYELKPNAVNIPGESNPSCCQPAKQPTNVNGLFKQYQGYIPQKQLIVDNSDSSKAVVETGDMLVKDTTIKEAQVICIKMEGCKGFTFEGTPDQNTKKTIYFKDFWAVHAKNGWLAYEVVVNNGEAADATGKHPTSLFLWVLLLSTVAVFSNREFF